MTAPREPWVDVALRVAADPDDAYSARAVGIMAFGQVLNGEHGAAAGMLAALTPDQCATVAAAANTLYDLAHQRRIDVEGRRLVDDDWHRLGYTHPSRQPLDVTPELLGDDARRRGYGGPA